jgi:phenylacetate-CoA ligase
MPNIRKLANSLPYPLEQGVKYIYGAIPLSLRYGKVFSDTYKFLQESQWWSRQKLEEYQMQQLNIVLSHAYENVPYYRKVFDERGLKPGDIQNFADLRKLPYLTRDIIQNNLPDLVARNYPKSKLQYVTTGGSTGIPLGFYYEKGISEVKELAFMLSQWNRVGFKAGDRCVVLRGNIIPGADKGKLGEYDPVSKNLCLSAYHMTDRNLPTYIKKIREFQPDYIQAYPSAAIILAQFMKGNNINPFCSVKGLLCGSENIYTWQRKMLEEVLQCRVYSWYGHTEIVALAGECEFSTYYHLFPEYGITELIGDTGKLVTEENTMGEIIATGFNNYTCPFIRYRTMDLATRLNTLCKCGRQYPLLKRVDGRLQDLVLTKDNRQITLTALIFSQHFEAFSKIKEMQLIQEAKGKIIVRIVKTPQFSISDEYEIQMKMQKAVSNGLDVSFEYVSHIPLTKNGKRRFLDQKLPMRFGD